MSTPDTETPTKITPVESFILGVIVAALFAIPISYRMGMAAERERVNRVGTAMDQARQRHRDHMVRASKRLEFIHQCVDDLDHQSCTSDVLSFCAKEAKHW